MDDLDLHSMSQLYEKLVSSVSIFSNNAPPPQKKQKQKQNKKTKQNKNKNKNKTKQNKKSLQSIWFKFSIDTAGWFVDAHA